MGRTLKFSLKMHICHVVSPTATDQSKIVRTHCVATHSNFELSAFVFLVHRKSNEAPEQRSNYCIISFRYHRWNETTIHTPPGRANKPMLEKDEQTTGWWTIIIIYANDVARSLRHRHCLYHCGTYLRNGSAVRHTIRSPTRRRQTNDCICTQKSQMQMCFKHVRSDHFPFSRFTLFAVKLY